MKNLLMTERWRPKTLEDMILLPRIKNIFKNGLDSNYLLYGNFGTGKTTLSRILIGKYSKNAPFIEINSSFYTSIDTLRSKIDEFCSKVYMGIDLDTDIKKDDVKYVFLDEFERTSLQYQDALKAYIEEYSSKNVRFILTTNHINKVSPGIRSRLIEVNFDFQNSDEEKFLKREIYKKIVEKIIPTENIPLTKSDLVQIINKNFPDFRSILLDLDAFRISGTLNSDNQVNSEVKSQTFDLLLSNNNDFEQIYNFIISNFGPDGIDKLILLLGKPLTDHLISKSIPSEKLFKANYIVCDYSVLLEKSTDPLILGITIFGKLKDLLKDSTN